MYTFAILKRIWKELSSSRKKQFIVLTLFTILVGFTEISVAGFISVLGITLSSPDSIQSIPIIHQLYELEFIKNIPLSEAAKPIILILLLIVIASAIKCLLNMIMTLQTFKISQTICWDFAEKLFKNYMRAPYLWHSQKNSANLHTHLVWRVNVGIYCSCVLTIFSKLTIAIFLAASGFIIAPFEFLIFCSLASFFSLLVYKFTQSKASACGEELKEINLGANKLSLAALHGLREVQIYNQQEAFEKAYTQYAAPAISAMTRLGIYPSIPAWVLETIGMALLLLVVFIMSYRGANLVEISGTLAMLAAISWRLLPSMTAVVGNILQLKLYYAQVELILDDLDVENSPAINAHTPFEKSLELKEVSFTYPKANEPSLENVSFKVSHGQMVGVVGVSGSGKSTLISIISGLYAQSSGKILIDDKEVCSSPGYLKIGYVPQSPYLMDASLAANVAFSDFGNEPNIEKVMHCCRLAAMDFIDELPLGVDTILGERGMRLSGGQIQRVAIARALYSDPDILLFDEATSALDGAAEVAIQKTIVSLHKNITIIIIAHRLSTVEECDSIHWLKDGTLYRSGKVEEILPEYSQFLKTKSTEYIS